MSLNPSQGPSPSPHHGLFAPQFTGFDLYTASEASPLTVEVRPAGL